MLITRPRAVLTGSAVQQHRSGGYGNFEQQDSEYFRGNCHAGRMLQYVGIYQQIPTYRNIALERVLKTLDSVNASTTLE